jgi:hypothetical protein
MYINGQLNAVRECSPDPITFTGGYDDDKVNIGRFTTTLGSPRYHFKGKLDELCIFSRALSAAEVKQIYNSGITIISIPDPLFVDPVNDDYHLKSERGRYWPEHDVWVLDKQTSPCVDAGDPLSDYSAEPSPNGQRINLGAYGGTPFASMSEWPLEWDWNHDGIVDLDDLAILTNWWLDNVEWDL